MVVFKMIKKHNSKYKAQCIFKIILQILKQHILFPDRGQRPTTCFNKRTGEDETVSEMVPELIVPDLTGFEVSFNSYFESITSSFT